MWRVVACQIIIQHKIIRPSRCKSGVERGSFSRFKSRGGVANLRSPIKSSLDHLSERQPPIEGCSAASPDFNAKEGRRTRNEGHKETTLVYVEEPTRTSLEGTRSGIFQRNAKVTQKSTELPLKRFIGKTPLMGRIYLPRNR